MSLRRQNAPTREKDLETLIVLACALLILAMASRRVILSSLALLLLLSGLLSKTTASWISRGWLRISERVGTFNSRVILGFIFFVVLTPIAFIYRKVAKNPLRLTNDVDGQSLFVTRDRLYGKSEFEKMW